MLTDREVKKPGVRLIIKSKTVHDLILSAAKRALPTVGNSYLKSALKAISLGDHDLQELREEHYPYSWAGTPAHEDDREVHIQSGKLYSSLKISEIVETDKRMGVYLVSNDPVMEWLIYGTSTMRPRRFHEKAYEEMKQSLWDPMTDELKKVKYKIETAR